MVNLNILNNYKHSLLLKVNEYTYDFLNYKDFDSFKNEYYKNIYFNENTHINSLCFDSFEESIIDTLQLKEHSENQQHILLSKNINNNMINEIISILNNKGIDSSDIVVVDSFDKSPFKAVKIDDVEHPICNDFLISAAIDSLAMKEELNKDKIELIQSIEKSKPIPEDIYNQSDYFIEVYKSLLKILNTDTYYDSTKHYILNFESIHERSILASLFKHISIYDKERYFSTSQRHKNCKLYLDCNDFLNYCFTVFPASVGGLYSYHMFIGDPNNPEKVYNFKNSSFNEVIGTCSLFYSKKDNELFNDLEKTGRYLKTNTSKKERLSQIKNLVFLKKTNY